MKGAWNADLLEQRGQSVPVEDGEIKLNCHPFEFVTLRISLKHSGLPTAVLRVTAALRFYGFGGRKATCSMGKISAVGVPSAALGTGSSDSALQGLWHAMINLWALRSG